MILRSRTRWLALPALVLFLCGFSRADILKIVVNGAIHPLTDEFIGRAIEAAEQRNSRALLIELQTPGGLAESTREIMQKIVASKVPVIVYVAPSGARAASAGFFILQAADVAAMAPGTNTGAAHPVPMGGGDVGKTMGEKIENDAAALIRSIVSKRGRNVEAAESAVRQSISFTEEEALEKKVIDLVAASERELLEKLEGRSLTRWDGSTLKLQVAGENVETLEMTVRQRVLNALMDPNMAFSLLALGVVMLYVEFSNPGLVVPGVIGTLSVILAIFALNILPVNYAALALILLAFVFFVLEAKFASYGALTIAGIAALVIGALLLVDGPIPQLRVQLWTALAVSVPLGLIATFLMTIAVRAQRNKITTGVQGLVGETGVARTSLTPEGKVFVHGEIWDATSSSPIAPGEAVRVLGIREFQLEVEPLTTEKRTEP
ncbi:MAG: nodulation protein NfeD [Candidatus Korobacteraceae bacterium]